MDSGLKNEVRLYERDKHLSDLEIERNKSNFSNALINGLGEEILNELEKEYIKPSMWDNIKSKIKKFKYKVKNIL